MVSDGSMHMGILHITPDCCTIYDGISGQLHDAYVSCYLYILTLMKLKTPQQRNIRVQYEKSYNRITGKGNHKKHNINWSRSFSQPDNSRACGAVALLVLFNIAHNRKMSKSICETARFEVMPIIQKLMEKHKNILYAKDQHISQNTKYNQ